MPGDLIFIELYELFSSPLADIDCGEKCGAYNDYGVPVCCDIRLVIPAAYQQEWAYLQGATDLWHPWASNEDVKTGDLEKDLQDGQVLLECLGYQHCQRQYRSITCRAFPFYPYLTGAGEFSGLAYYRDFRRGCWIISNLGVVSQQYKREFQQAYQRLFEVFPQSREAYGDFSAAMREETARREEFLVLLDFSGGLCLVDPVTEAVTEGSYQDLEAYGPFLAARDLVFPDELSDLKTDINHE
jgi:hypothetical protein